LRWTGQQQDEVERVTGGGKSSIVSIEGKKLKDPKQDLYVGPSEILYLAIFRTYLWNCKGNSVIDFEGNHFISSDRTETGTTRMNVVITS
jgi:hypothetical protein